MYNIQKGGGSMYNTQKGGSTVYTMIVPTTSPKVNDENSAIHADFSMFLRLNALEPLNENESFIADGTVRRYAVSGDDPGETAASYCLTVEPDGTISGWVENHRTTDGVLWYHSTCAAVTPTDISTSTKKTKKEKNTQHEYAAGMAAKILAAGKATKAHPYTTRKHVLIHAGIRVSSNGELLIPLYSCDGALQTLQKIAPDGTKRLLRGGKKTGAAFCLGKSYDRGTKNGKWPRRSGCICLCEGYATAATVRKYTPRDAHVLFCVDAGNMVHVAEICAKKYPTAVFYICADNDAYAKAGKKRKESENPGIVAARKAQGILKSAGKHAHILAPNIEKLPEEERVTVTDWNDLCNLNHVECAAQLTFPEAPAALPPEDEEEEEPQECTTGTRKKTKAAALRLFDAVLERGYTPFSDSVSETEYIEGPDGKIVPLFGPVADILLQDVYAEITEGVSIGKKDDRIVALTRLRVKARENPRKCYKRTGMHEGNVYISLAENGFIKITPRGWEIVPHAPVTFVPSPARKSLPVPTRGGRMDALFELIPNVEEPGKIELMKWVLGALLPLDKYPILFLEGCAGSGKTTAKCILKYLVDADADENLLFNRSVYTFPKDDVLGPMAGEEHVTTFDNITYISASETTKLCEIATSGKIQVRELYTHQMLKYRVGNPVIITTISYQTGRNAADLEERSLHVELFPRDTFLEDSAIEAQMREILPGVLGAFCDAISAALSQMGTAAAATDRMAMFEKFISSAEFAGKCPWAVKTRLKEAKTQKERKAYESLENSAVVQILFRMFGIGYTVEETEEMWSYVRSTRKIERADEKISTRHFVDIVNMLREKPEYGLHRKQYTLQAVKQKLKNAQKSAATVGIHISFTCERDHSYIHVTR